MSVESLGNLETFEKKETDFSWGQSLEWLGHFFSIPFHRSTETVVPILFTPIQMAKCGPLDCRILEIAKRIFSFAFHALIAPITLSLHCLGVGLQTLGEWMTRKPYYHVQGDVPERWNSNAFTLMTLNACMYWGGLPITGGGVGPARERIDALSALLHTRNPDLVVLQEVSFGPGLELASRLKDLYAHQYTNIGAFYSRPILTSLGPELFVASKAPLVSEPRFIPYPDAARERLGFFCIETPSCWAITAHFPDGVEKAATRQVLVQQIHETIQQLKTETGKPCFLMGDLNIRRTEEENDEYARSGILNKFHDPYTQQHPECSEETATCTNGLECQKMGKPIHEPSFEIDDYLLIDRESRDRFQIDVTLGKETYDLKNPDRAVTDHRYYFATVKNEE